MAQSRPTITDVAKQAGVSTASVSYYLNGKTDKLGVKTQQRIARVIRDTGYVPNAQAQTLNGKDTHVIAVFILDNTNIWAGKVLNGIEQVAHANGYQTVVCTTNFSVETESMYVEKMLSLGADGFIIQPTSNFRAIKERIERAGRPVIFYDCDLYSLDTPWIKTNLYDGVYTAITACIEAGYEEFLTLAADTTRMRTRMERFRGFADALAAHGLTYRELAVQHDTPSVSALADHFKFKLNPARRTLIFVQNQWALARVFRALQPMAHLMPHQIGLIGLNGDEWTGLTTPSISTIIEPIDEEGRRACEMLLSLLGGQAPEAPQQVLDCTINWQASTSVPT